MASAASAATRRGKLIAVATDVRSVSASASLVCIADTDTLSVATLVRQLRLVLRNDAGASGECSAGGGGGGGDEEMFAALVEHVEQCAEAGTVHSLAQLRAELCSAASVDPYLQRYVPLLDILCAYMHALGAAGGAAGGACGVYSETVRAHVALHGEHRPRVRMALDDIDRGALGGARCTLDACVALVESWGAGSQPARSDGGGHDEEAGDDDDLFGPMHSLLCELRDKRKAHLSVSMRDLCAHMQRVHHEHIARDEFTIDTNKSGTALAVRIPRYQCTVTMHGSFALQTRGAKSFAAARHSVDYFTALLRAALPGDAFWLCHYAVYNTMVRASTGHRIDLALYAAAARAAPVSAPALGYTISYGDANAAETRGGSNCDDEHDSSGSGACAAPAVANSGRLYHYIAIAAAARAQKRRGGGGRHKITGFGAAALEPGSGVGENNVESDTDLGGGSSKSREPHITISIFSSGTLWIVGATEPEHVKCAFEAVRGIANECRGK